MKIKVTWYSNPHKEYEPHKSRVYYVDHTGKLSALTTEQLHNAIPANVDPYTASYDVIKAELDKLLISPDTAVYISNKNLDEVNDDKRIRDWFCAPIYGFCIFKWWGNCTGDYVTVTKVRD